MLRYSSLSVRYICFFFLFLIYYSYSVLFGTFPLTTAKDIPPSQISNHGIYSAPSVSQCTDENRKLTIDWFGKNVTETGHVEDKVVFPLRRKLCHIFHVLWRHKTIFCLVCVREGGTLSVLNFLGRKQLSCTCFITLVRVFLHSRSVMHSINFLGRF